MTRDGQVRDPALATPASIRRLAETDLEAYRALRLSALKSDPLAFGSTFELESGYAESRWIDRLRQGANSPGDAVLVAEVEGGRLVGMIGTFSKDGAFHLFGMWVRPEVRRWGIGSRLLDELLSWISIADPSAPVLLSVNPTQVGAVRLYLSHGFRPTGLVEPLGHTPDAVVHEMRWTGRRGAAEANP